MSDQQITRFQSVKNPQLMTALLLAIIMVAGMGIGIDARALASVRIGVLAHKGTDICRDMWQPTMDYLENALSDRQFDLVPLQFNEIETAVKDESIDFLICNPAIYVDLEVKYGVSRTMTLRNLVGTQIVSEFGGVIFCRADRDELKSLRDVRGKSLAAVRETSFGGWHMALREFRSAGIDPERNCARLFFPGSHPAVVRAVLSGDADIGTVRTDTIERMAADGEIRMDEIRVFSADAATRLRSLFPYLLSTRLYPEWPFAKLSVTTEDLSREVTVALLSMSAGSPAAVAAQSGGWSVCLDYTSVHDCLRELRMPPYEHYGQMSWPDMWRQHWPWLGAIAALITALLGSLLLLRGRQLAVMRVSGQNRLLLASAGEGICGMDVAGIITFVNPAASKMLGYTVGELLGKNLHALTHHTKPDKQPYPNHECPICKACNDSSVHQGSDEFFYRKDGSAFPVSYSRRPIVDMGRILGAVICFKDITDRKHAEEMLCESEDRLRQALDAAHIGDWELDLVTNQSRRSHRYCEIFGQTAQMQGWDVKVFLDYVHPEDCTRVAASIQGIPAVDQDWHDEFRIVRDDKAVRWVWARSHIFKDSQGQPSKMYGMVSDITEQKRVEEELLHINETLEQRVVQEVEKNQKHELLLVQQSRLAAMGEMIGNIAHQWRQPLNALGLLLFNIKDAFQFDALDAAFLDQSMMDGNRLVQKMSATISDFSNFFRPDKEIIVFSALKQIREAVALVESSFQHSNIAIHIDVSHDLKLLGFPNEYSQVLLNLLSNAKEAILARNQPLSGRVDIILTECGGQGCVSVCDNGGGIPENILDRIFDPYFSTKETGTGIGLYMSKMIIEHNMNGSISARNIEGGAKFSVCAPLAK